MNTPPATGGTVRAPRPPSGGGILSQAGFYNAFGNRFGKPGSGAYTRYRQYRINKPKERAAARAGQAPTGQTQQMDPLAILTDAQLRARATAAVTAANAPVLAQLRSTYSQRGEEQAAQLASLTAAAVQAAGQYGPAVGAAYGGAQHDQAASDAALASLLHGGGVQAAGELAGQLGAASPVAAGAGAIGTGAAGANLATGSADLTRLISQGAAAQDYGAKLPGIAAGQGLETSKRMQAELDRQLAEAIGGVTSKQPGQVEDLYQQGANNRTSIALAQRSGYFAAQDAKTKATATAAAADAKAGLPNAALSAKYGYIVDSRGNPILSNGQRVKVAKTPKAGKPDTSGRPNAALSAKYGYIVDSNGNPVLRNGQRVPVASTKTPKGQKPVYTAQQRSTAFYSTRDKAITDAKALHGKGRSPGSNTAGPNAVSRGSAYKSLWTSYAPQLISQYGYKSAAVQQMINRALDAAGY